MHTVPIRLREFGLAGYALAVIAAGFLALVIAFNPAQTYLKLADLRRLEVQNTKLERALDIAVSKVVLFEENIEAAEIELEDARKASRGDLRSLGRKIPLWERKARESEKKADVIRDKRRVVLSREQSLFSTFGRIKLKLGVKIPVIFAASCVFLSVFPIICGLIFIIPASVYLLSSKELRANSAKLAVKIILAFFIVGGGAAAGTLAVLAKDLWL